MSLPADRFAHRVDLLRRRPDGGDEHGNPLGSWAEPVHLGRRWAAFRPEFGGEALAAGRVESGLVGVVTLRAEAVTRGLSAADRIRFVYAPYVAVTCEIVAVLPSPDGTEIELTVTQAMA